MVANTTLLLAGASAVASAGAICYTIFFLASSEAHGILNISLDFCLFRASFLFIYFLRMF